MKRFSPLVSGPLLLIGAALLGQPAPPADSSAPNPILAPAPPPIKLAARPRPVSATTAALLAAAVPPYTPPPKPAPGSPVLEQREDKPRNEIIRLPAYIVRERKEKIPAVSEFQVLTPKGKVALAFKAYPGLRLGSFWIFRNDQVALDMLDEEVSLERAHQIAELNSLLPVNDPGADSQSRRLIRESLAPRTSVSEMVIDSQPGN